MPTHTPVEQFLQTLDVARRNRRQPDPEAVLDSLIQERELFHLRDQLEALDPRAAVNTIRGGPPGQIMQRLDNARLTQMERAQDDRRGPPITGATGAPRPRRSELQELLNPRIKLNRLIREEELSHLRDDLHSITPEVAIALIENAPRGQLLRRIESQRMAEMEREQQNPSQPIRPRREELMGDPKGPAPGDVEAFPGLTSTLDSLSAILQDEIRVGRPLPGSSDAAGLTRPGRPNTMRLRPDFAGDRGVQAHETGHLVDFRSIPEFEAARRQIPERRLPNDASVLENLLDPVLDTGDRGEGFAEEVERALLNVDGDTDDEIQQTLRELLRNRLAQGEQRARERTRFTRDATAVRR